MMTSQTYRKVATVMCDAQVEALTSDEAERIHQNLVKALADMFASDNPRFNREEFYIVSLGRNYLRDLS